MNMVLIITACVLTRYCNRIYLLLKLYCNKQALKFHWVKYFNLKENFFKESNKDEHQDKMCILFVCVCVFVFFFKM